MSEQEHTSSHSGHHVASVTPSSHSHSISPINTQATPVTGVRSVNTTSAFTTTPHSSNNIISPTNSTRRTNIPSPLPLPQLQAQAQAQTISPQSQSLTPSAANLAAAAALIGPTGPAVTRKLPSSTSANLISSSAGTTPNSAVSIHTPVSFSSQPMGMTASGKQLPPNLLRPAPYAAPHSTLSAAQAIVAQTLPGHHSNAHVNSNNGNNSNASMSAAATSSSSFHALSSTSLPSSVPSNSALSTSLTASSSSGSLAAGLPSSTTQSLSSSSSNPSSSTIANNTNGNISTVNANNPIPMLSAAHLSHLHQRQPSHGSLAPLPVSNQLQLPLTTTHSLRPPTVTITPVAPMDEVSDSEMEDSIVLKDGRRFPTAEKEKHVNLLQLIAIVYFCVVGGPYGLEDGVAAGGSGWVLLLLIILPFCAHLPIGLLTSELASAMPQNGGYIIWVSRAFGNFWGYMEGWFSWSSSLVDTALYPCIGVAYIEFFLKTYFQISFSFWQVYAARLALGLLVMVSSVCNVQVMGMMSLVFAAVTLLPFFFLAFLGFRDFDFSQATQLRPVDQVSWGVMINVILWVGSGWDSPGSVAGDVKQPKKTYPRGVFITLILVIITNILPIAVAVCIFTDYTSDIYSTTSGFWALLAGQVGGSFFQMLMILAALCSNLSMFNVLLTSSSWALYALSLPGLLDAPSLTKLQSKFRTPWVCIMINSIGIAICCLYSFTGLVQIAMGLNSCALILECASLVWLRLSEPKMKRPYRIPLSTSWLALFMVPPVTVFLASILTMEEVPSRVVYLTTGLGIISFWIARIVERVSQGEDGPLPAVDLVDVFDEVQEQQMAHVVQTEGEEAMDNAFFPDLGLRFALHVEQLPEAIVGNMQDNGDNYMPHEDTHDLDQDQEEEEDDVSEEDQENDGKTHLSTSASSSLLNDKHSKDYMSTKSTTLERVKE